MNATKRRLYRSVGRKRLRVAPVAGILLVIACGDNGFDPAPGGTLAIGAWGADGAGVIVDESGVHVHVGCTFGDIVGRVPVVDGRFTIDGSYMLRAYPIAVGPTVPAQFSGQIVGRTLTLAIAVDDTVENQIVRLGPVSVEFGTEPNMAPCPICEFPPAAAERSPRN